MLSVTNLRDFLTEAAAEINTINYTNIVVDDSQLISLLKEREIDENNYLIAIVPQFGLIGQEDIAKWNNQLMFMVMCKYTSRDITLDEQVDVLESTRISSRSLIELMLSKKIGENGQFCGLMNELVENSIEITPVWEKAQCCGWMIQIDLVTRF
jgi:hypothetical protein